MAPPTEFWLQRTSFCPAQRRTSSPPRIGDGDSRRNSFFSLQRIAALPIDLLLPAHGEPFGDAAGRARRAMAHTIAGLKFMDPLETGVFEVS